MVQMVFVDSMLRGGCGVVHPRQSAIGSHQFRRHRGPRERGDRGTKKDVVRGVQPVVRRSEWADMCRIRVGTGETLQARTAYLAPVVVPCVGRKLAAIRRRIELPSSLAALLHA